MGIKRYLNVFITLVLFIACLFAVYLLGLDKTEGHRALGDRHLENEEYEQALEEYRLALLIEFDDELKEALGEEQEEEGEGEETAEGEEKRTIEDLSLDEILELLRSQDVTNERVVAGIYDTWYLQSKEVLDTYRRVKDQFDYANRVQETVTMAAPEEEAEEGTAEGEAEGEEAEGAVEEEEEEVVPIRLIPDNVIDEFLEAGWKLLEAEGYLKTIRNNELGSYYDDAVELLDEVQAELDEEITITVGEREIDAYTVDLPDPPPTWDPEEGPWDQYKYVVREDVKEKTLTVRTYLLYPDQNKMRIIDDYASAENARAFMTEMGSLVDDSPIQMAVLAAERLDKIELGEFDSIEAGELRYFMMLNVALKNVSDKPYTITLKDPAMLRLYRRREANMDEPMTSEYEDRKSINRDFFDDEFTIQPGETVTGWVLFWTYESDQYYFKVIQMLEDERTGTQYSEAVAGKRLPNFGD